MPLAAALPDRARPVLQWVGVGVLVGLSGWLGLELSREAGRVASIWFANGLLVGLLLVVPAARGLSWIFAGFLGNAAANLLLGEPLPVALGFSLCNSLEVAIAVLLLERRPGQPAELDRPAALSWFLLMAVGLAPALSGLAAAFLLGRTGSALLELLAQWYPANALGMAITVPLVLALCRHGEAAARRPGLAAALLSALPLLLVTLLVFRWARWPILFLALPPLTFLVSRLGYAGAALGLAILTAGALPATLRGHGPIAAVSELSLQQQILLLQGFLATAALLALVQASLLEQRRRYGRELARSERLLRSVTDNVPALIAHIDAEQRYRFVNAHNGRVYGTDPRTMLGRSMREVRGEALYRELQPYVQRTLRGEVVSFESYRVAGGVGRYYQSSYVPERGADGCISGFYSLTFDISERKETELLLAQSEKRLRMITDHLPGLIAYIDREQRYRFANEYHRAVFGLDPISLLGKTLREVLGEALYATLAESIAGVLRGETVRFEHGGFEPRPALHFLVDYTPDIDGQGEVQGFYVSMMDITARKQAELRHAADEERLRTITDNLPVLIAYLDSERIYRFCNRAHESWLGKPAAELLGRRIDEVLEPQVYEPQRYFLDCALNGARAEGSFEISGAQGRRHLQVSYLPQLDAEGQVLGVYALTTDVTPLKRVERQLRQLARFDPLTGLANRREFNERFAAALARSRRSGGSLALLFIDVDHFKQINDTYGHSGGDEVLQEIALRIRNAVRQTDIVARFAGDEFVILLDQLLSADEPQFVARKVLAAMSKPFMLDRGATQVSVSVGVARDLDHHSSVEQLMKRADKALYAAKNAGRNTSRLAE